MRQGWDPRYKIWVEHGEPAPPTPPPVIDNTRQPLMSDMTALLNDLSYIPPNNEHNEPTQGDIGETSNEPTQATRNEFEELYASANEELYPGCDYVTRLDFMAKFTYFKAKGRLTDSIFNEMLEFFQNVFPISKGFKLPPSYYAIKKTFKTIGLGYESIHACEHDCCLFRGDNNKDLDFCPVCNTSRWKDSNTPGKKVPKKVLRYFPIIPRLQRLYKSSHTAKDMIWHATGNAKVNDSPIWAEGRRTDPTTGSYDVEAIRRARPEKITTAEWDKYIKFWNDPKNLARAAQNRLNRQKSVVTSRQGSRSLARLRDEMYEQASGHSGVPPYSLTPSGEQTLVDGGWSTREDEFNAVARGVQLRGPHSGVGVVLPSTGQIPGQKRLPQYSDMFKEIVWGGATGVGVWLMTSEE
ncbi:hypothetical protein Tco_0087034 [Tanacetum coccineum]